MTTNRNHGVSGVLLLFAVTLALGLMGCSEPGPRALLQGKELVEQGNYGDAVKKLEKATSLLPKNALAWNLLGLAYHGNRQPEHAAKAYRTALSLDHKLSEVRYNLGCLQFEQTNLPSAIEEFRSYTLLQPGAVNGWLKYGTALLRAHRLEDSERSFRTALELQVRHPEALNGLGLIQLQRRRWQEALNHFNAAATQQPPYPPAILNIAVLQQQYLNNRTQALQRYRQYLALQPRPAQWESVDAAARQLEQELNPTPPPPAAIAVAAPAARTDKTNTPSVPAKVALRPMPPTPVTTTAPSVRSNPPPALTASKPAPAHVSQATNTPSNIPRPIPDLARTPAKPPAWKTNSPPAAAAPAPASRPAEFEVAEVQTNLVVSPAKELSARPASPVEKASAGAKPAEAASSPGSKGFLSRINPFKSKPAGGTNVAETKEPEAAPVVARATPTTPTTADPKAPVGKRYTYLAPAKPTAGNRIQAEKEFRRGLAAQKSGDRSAAVAGYQAAVRVDPAYFDAYHNLGLAALDRGEVALALWAYEIALALKPDAEDTRYNFALALKAGGYWQDAADQLGHVLAENPTASRAHLSLANLYAQQLRQTQPAREHYQRVLELDPRHPESAKIRYWLATNP